MNTILDNNESTEHLGERIRSAPNLLSLFRPRITEARLTATLLPAIAFLIIVHGTILAGFLAARRLCRKTSAANGCRQNRKQNFCRRLHAPNFAREIK